MNKNLPMVGVTLASLLIGGTQLFAGSNRQLQPGLRFQAETDSPTRAAEKLALGRSALDAGNYAKAVAAFRAAALEPELAAAAHNGQAVAYSRIGRNDLAERYFAKAIAVAPDEGRYHEDLSRLEQAEGLDRADRILAQAREAEQLELSKTRLLPGHALLAGLRADRPRDQIIRPSASEVMLKDLARASAPPPVLAASPIIIASRPEPAPERTATAAVPQVVSPHDQLMRLSASEVTLKSRARSSAPPTMQLASPIVVASATEPAAERVATTVPQLTKAALVAAPIESDVPIKPQSEARLVLFDPPPPRHAASADRAAEGRSGRPAVHSAGLIPRELPRPEFGSRRAAAELAEADPATTQGRSAVSAPGLRPRAEPQSPKASRDHMASVDWSDILAVAPVPSKTISQTDLPQPQFGPDIAPGGGGPVEISAL